MVLKTYQSIVKAFWDYFVDFCGAISHKMNPSLEENFKVSIVLTRLCPLRRYLLGVLMHTTAWD